MKKTILTLSMSVLALSVNAQARPQVLMATTPENIPTTAGSVSQINIPAGTVVTASIPYFASGYIMSGDNAWVCDNSKRCNVNSFPLTTVSQTGWVFNPQARNLVTNLQVSQSVIGLYARPQDIVSGTNTVSFEWFCQGTCQ